MGHLIDTGRTSGHPCASSQEARARGYRRLSLETGAAQAFAPAQKLYESFGFAYCGPFAGYKPDPNSVFMTLEL